LNSLVTTTWRALRLQMEEDAYIICRAAMDILNKHSRTAGKRWSYSLTVRRGFSLLKNFTISK
jgi:hypothetical protein